MKHATSPSRMPPNLCSGLVNSVGGSSIWPLNRKAHGQAPGPFSSPGQFHHKEVSNMTTNESELLEAMRRSRLVEINVARADQSTLEARHGQVWDTKNLARDFEVLGFAAPYVVVRRKSDSALGSLEFQHEPRLYFNFEADRPNEHCLQSAT